MPMLIPAAVAYGASAAATAAGASAFTASVISAAAAAATAAAIANREKVRANRIARAQFNSSLRDQMVTVKGGVNPRPIVYGRAALGGQLVYAETFGSVKEHLVMVIALAHGEVDAIEGVYFNDQLLTIDGSNYVTTAPYSFGVVNQNAQTSVVPGAPYQVTLAATPDSGLIGVQDVTSGFGGGDSGSPIVPLPGIDYTVSGTTVTFAAAYSGRTMQISYATTAASQSYAAIWRYTGAPGQDLSTTMLALGAPSWTANDKCEGMAALIVRLTFAENIWPNGIPNIKAVIRGRKCYDPRSATTVWTRNAALCARDYLRFQYGVNAADAKLDDTATIAAANICDEDVQLTATPTYQDRYTVDGVIQTGDDRLTNLDKFAQSMAGSVNYSQGKWRIRAGAYSAPALTLDEAKLSDAGDISIVPYSTRRDLINGCKSTYINADKGYVEDQAPEWTSATFVTEDGSVAMTAAITLPMVTDVSRAQRLQKIAVYRTREALALACTCNFSTYAWQVGDMVTVNLARYGFSAKPMRVVQRGFSVDGGMRYTFREEPNGIYDWNLGEASILSGAGNTTLPNPASVLPPVITGIASAGYLYKSGDGTFVARILVSVTSPADQYVRLGGRLELEYKRGDWSVAQWVRVTAPGDATAIWIDPAFDAQNYLIRVRAVNSAGYASAWTAAQVHTCIGRLGATENLLRNSDWTEDLGYPAGITFYSDARALRHWSAGGNPGQFARNYDSGKTWNIGPGGCSIYIPSNTVGHYAYVYQDVPVVAGVAYEASAYVATHRGASQVIVQFLNAGLSSLLQIGETYNSGSAVDGSAYDAATRRRLWCSGTAPANTVWARFIVLIECTASSSPYPFSAWHRAMFCVAPSGVTKQTATPWIEGNSSTVRGQSYPIDAETTVTDFGGFSYNLGGNYYYHRSASWSLEITLAVFAGDSVLIDLDGWATLDGGGTGYMTAITDVLVSGSGKVLFDEDSGQETGNLRYHFGPYFAPADGSQRGTFLDNRIYTAAVDQTITIAAIIGWDLNANAGDGYGHMRVQRIKL